MGFNLKDIILIVRIAKLIFKVLYFSSTRNITSSPTDQFFADTDIGPDKYRSIKDCKEQGWFRYALIGTSEKRVYLSYAEQILSKHHWINIIIEQLGFEAIYSEDRDEVFDIVKEESESTFCFGLQIDSFDINADDYEF